MDKLIIFGNGAVAEVLFYYLKRDTDFQLSGFTVDRNVLQRDTLLDLPVVPFDEVTERFPPDEFKMMIAVGYVKVNQLRAERFYQAKELGYELVSYTSPKASIWSGLEIGENCRIGDHCTISPYTKIGNDVWIGSGSGIGHHVVIKDHCYFSTRVSVAGFVTIEPYCYIGTGAVIRNNITIARSCIIGAGAVILGDTQEKGVYMAPSAEKLPINSDQISPK
jgi:sugar O-acyltransferase (sialic acid O-acetyltransferase NeuD family)